jgi:hypothetical protein
MFMAIGTIEIFTLAAFAAVGFWLGRTGGRNGLLDKLLTPIPMIALGLIYIAARLVFQ